MQVFKPKISVNAVNPHHASHLDNIVNGGLMRKKTPEPITEHFIEQGYVRQAIGGLVPTEHGHKALMMYNKTK